MADSNFTNTNPSDKPLIIDIVLRPHIERFGGHTERFDALLDDKVICTSRSGWNDPARALLALGYPPEALLRVRHEGHPIPEGVKLETIGELAKWTWEESDRHGIRKVPWRPSEERFAKLRTRVQERDGTPSGQNDTPEQDGDAPEAEHTEPGGDA
jgi:hypothetical protein